MYKLIVLSLFFAYTQALYPHHSHVIELTPDNFDKLVINSDEIWVVEFFAPWCGHCKALVPEYTKAALGLKGVVKVGALDADKHRSVSGNYGIQGFPTIKIFGVNKKKPTDYNGARTAQGIVDAALQEVTKKVKKALGGGGSSENAKNDNTNSNDVVELTDRNFDEIVLQSDDIWLVEFYAPWCGHCKNLAPHWAKAATELKGKVKLGALDATEHQAKASQYGVQGYPTIKFFPAGKKTSNSAQNYEGGRTSDDIVAWALDQLAESIKPPEIVEITNTQTFNEQCKDKPLCVVSILPHILDCNADCRNKYLEILTNIGNKFKKMLWGWVWAEGGAQSKLEDALDVGGFGYPAMAVLNAKKMKYSLLRGAFSSEGINEFLRDLSYSRGNTASLKGNALPEIATTTPWDGKDGELPQEEDIDLSDVDLDEKDEL